jgi:hypothetical protein
VNDVKRSLQPKLRLAASLAVLLGCVASSGCGPALAATVVEMEKKKEADEKKKKKKKKQQQLQGNSFIAGPGSARLSWTPPTSRVDGTPLGSDLAGYKVYRGTTSRTYDTVVDLANPLTTNHFFDQLPPGRYYFAVSAYDSQGVESGYSTEVDKLVE